MSLRSCKHCWKTVDDEEHYWFCPFGDGIHPERDNQKEPGGGNDSGGGGGGEPGERNIPIIPTGGGPGGVAAIPSYMEVLPSKSSPHGKVGPTDRAALAIEGHATRGLDVEAKSVMIEHKPMLALPVPVETGDEQELRNYSVGKRGSSSDLA